MGSGILRRLWSLAVNDRKPFLRKYLLGAAVNVRAPINGLTRQCRPSQLIYFDEESSSFAFTASAD